MAEITMLVDDMDGTSEKSRPVKAHTFSLDGVEYEIDLHDENADQLRESFAQYIKVARAVNQVASGHAKVAVTKKTHQDKLQLDAKREWAARNGFTVSKFGKIPAQVEEAYAALAHPTNRERNGSAFGQEIFSAAV